MSANEWSARVLKGSLLHEQEPRVSRKLIDSPPPTSGSIAPEMRTYLLERRRALLTELKALNSLLGLKT